MNVTLKVYRFNPEKDTEPHYDVFNVEAEPNDRILDCLNKIRWQRVSHVMCPWNLRFRRLNN